MSTSSSSSSSSSTCASHLSALSTAADQVHTVATVTEIAAKVAGAFIPGVGSFTHVVSEHAHEISEAATATSVIAEVAADNLTDEIPSPKSPESQPLPSQPKLDRRGSFCFRVSQSAGILAHQAEKVAVFSMLAGAGAGAAAAALPVTAPVTVPAALGAHSLSTTFSGVAATAAATKLIAEVIVRLEQWGDKSSESSDVKSKDSDSEEEGQPKPVAQGAGGMPVAAMATLAALKSAIEGRDSVLKPSSSREFNLKPSSSKDANLKRSSSQDSNSDEEKATPTATPTAAVDRSQRTAYCFS